MLGSRDFILFFKGSDLPATTQGDDHWSWLRWFEHLWTTVGGSQSRGRECGLPHNGTASELAERLATHVAEEELLRHSKYPKTMKIDRVGYQHLVVTSTLLSRLMQCISALGAHPKAFWKGLLWLLNKQKTCSSPKEKNIFNITISIGLEKLSLLGHEYI